MTPESNPKNIGTYAIIAVVVLVILILVVNHASSTRDEVIKQDSTVSTKSVNINYQSPSNSYSELTYKTILTIKGSGRRKSKLFHLSGSDAKLVFKYNSLSESIGVFGVYVVDDGVDIMKTGGFPELESTLTHDSGESELHKSAGDYYLDINAAGSYTVKVEELQ